MPPVPHVPQQLPRKEGDAAPFTSAGTIAGEGSMEVDTSYDSFVSPSPIIQTKIPDRSRSSSRDSRRYDTRERR